MICNKCGTAKDPTDFYFRKSRNQHRQPCKTCANAVSRLWDFRNSEKCLIYSRRSNAIAKATPGYYARTRAFDKKRYDRFLMVEKIRRARVRKAGGYVLPLDVNMRAIKRTFDWAGGRCQYCGHSGRKLHIDHIVPPKLGGDHVPGNWMVACASCNGSKRSTPVLEWIKKRFCHGLKVSF